MKQYHVASNGQQSGPYSEADVQRKLAAHELQNTDLCWTEGMPDWKAIALVLPGASDLPPTLPVLGVASQSGTTDFEKIRKEYIKHEASVKSVGVLYLLGGGIVALSAIASVFGTTHNRSISIGVGGALLLLAVLQIWTGIEIRKLNKKARLPVGVLSGLGLLGFPIGTLISTYILYLVFGKKGKYVFSDEYQEVIRATPQIKYKTSGLIWIFLGLVVLLVVLGVTVAIFSKR